MKLLTYNIHYWEGIDGIIDVERVVQVIRDSGADIVGLNEVFHPVLAPGIEQPALTYMAQALKMHVVFGQAQGYDTVFDRPKESFGNAILSRWPILASASHHLTAAEGSTQRGLLEARILLPGEGGRTLTIYVTHLDPHDEATRLTQVKALLLWCSRDRTRPHVLMGDFNTYSPEDIADAAAKEGFLARIEALNWEFYEPSVVPRLVKNGYIDTWTRAGSGQHGTYQTPDPGFRIDYIFVSEPLAATVSACRVWDTGLAKEASDHFPVFVELEVEDVECWKV